MVSYCYPPHPLIALIGLCTNFWEGICISSDVIRIHVYINGLSSPRSAWAMETQTRDSMSKVVWEMTIICSLSCIFFLWNILFWRLRVSKVWRFSVVSCLVLIHSTQVSLRDMMGLTNHLEMEVVSWYIFAAYNVDFVVFSPFFYTFIRRKFPFMNMIERTMSSIGDLYLYRKERKIDKNTKWSQDGILECTNNSSLSKPDIFL